MSTLYADRLETVMFEPNKISKEKTDTSYNATATIQFCAEHNARMATLEEGIVSLYSSSFSGFSFGYMKDYQTNQTYASHYYGVIFKDKLYYIGKWRKYLSKEEIHISKDINNPFELLTHLWAHKNVIKDLESIRLNPNLLNKKQIRNDLEFYIPQLW